MNAEERDILREIAYVARKAHEDIDSLIEELASLSANESAEVLADIIRGLE